MMFRCKVCGTTNTKGWWTFESYVWCDSHVPVEVKRMRLQQKFELFGY